MNQKYFLASHHNACSEVGRGADTRRAKIRARHCHRGLTQIEALLSLFILALLVAGTATLMNAGLKQQRFSRGYSNDQTDLRNALRVATRAIRHATGVINTGSQFGTLIGVQETSTANTLFVTVPEPTGAAASTIHQRYYLTSKGTFYKQRTDDTGAGIPLITNVTSLKFNYFQTVGTTRKVADPGNTNSLTTDQATEVLITIIVSQENTTTKATALVNLRNFDPGY